MNKFGGKWTQVKIEIIEAYARAYLTIMNRYEYLKPVYFDGFAGSGDIEQCNEDQSFDVVAGAARAILSIETPKTFHMYYFVEKCAQCKDLLEEMVRKEYCTRRTYVVQGDCNQKLVDFASFLSKHENRYCRGLAYVDPFGMQVNWASIQELKDRGIDLWILVPTGVGVNRMMKRDAEISEEWCETLQRFLGLPIEQIKARFYQESPQVSLFGDKVIEKIENSIEVAGELYSQQLKTVFTHVSKPFIMRNSKNSPMYHFVLATDNKAGLDIANDIIRKRL